MMNTLHVDVLDTIYINISFLLIVTVTCLKTLNKTIIHMYMYNYVKMVNLEGEEFCSSLTTTAG